MYIYFLGALLISVVSTFFVRALAERHAWLDLPDGSRKRHNNPVALLGGVAIFVAFWLPTLYLLFFHPILGIEKIESKLIVALVVSAILLSVGVADEIKKVSPQLRFLLVGLSVLIAVLGGIGIGKITNPTGGALELGLMLGDAVAFVWLFGMIFTIKILDGLDGLATGVALIGSIIIFFLTQSNSFYQPNVGVVSLIFAGALTGFLIFNFHPASIFLGESGGLIIGFILGVLSIISGSKIATALMVMAVPIVDFARVLYVRYRRGQPLFVGDREHWHYRLLDYGMTENQVVILFYIIALVSGLAALWLQSLGKIIAFGMLLIGILCIMFMLKKSHEPVVKDL